jgi:Mg/Co/Ni transporter MgtE
MQLPWPCAAANTDLDYSTGFLPYCAAITRLQQVESDMKKMISSFLAMAMLSSTMVISTGVMLPGTANAASKSYCRSYAKNYASKKTSRKVVRNLVIGGVVGGVLGAVVGGRTSTAIGAAGGAATGVIVGDAQWQKYYNRGYANCRQGY